jgi:hypothetical protein
VDQAKELRRRAESLQPAVHGLDQALEQSDTLGVQVEAVLPVPPVRLVADACLEGPAEALKPVGRCPAARVAVHARRYLAEGRKGGEEVLLVRLDAIEKFEEYAVAAARHLVGLDVVDEQAVGTGDHLRGPHAGLLAQGLHPGKLRIDGVAGVVAGAVHAHDYARAAAFDQIGRVLGMIDHAEGIVGGRQDIPDRLAGDTLQPLQQLVLGQFGRNVRHLPSLPRSSTARSSLPLRQKCALGS